MKQKTKKTIIWIVIAIVAIGAAIYGYNWYTRKDKDLEETDDTPKRDTDSSSSGSGSGSRPNSGTGTGNRPVNTNGEPLAQGNPRPVDNAFFKARPHTYAKGTAILRTSPSFEGREIKRFRDGEYIGVNTGKSVDAVAGDSTTRYVEINYQGQKAYVFSRNASSESSVRSERKPASLPAASSQPINSRPLNTTASRAPSQTPRQMRGLYQLA